nr:sulfatase [Gordonia soli]
MTTSSTGTAATSAQRDNIVFVHWHDLGRHLSCYGAEGVDSPHLDALAAESIRLTNAHATAPLCSPSRGSLFTGRYPHSNGLVGLAHHGFEYNDDVLTLPQLLGGAGWRTALFGMQHESSDPERLGFDELDVSDSLCDYVTERSQDWLRARQSAGDESPFLLTAGFFETHRPYPADQYPPADPHRLGVPGFLPDARPVREDLAGLLGSITKADAAVGRLLATIAELGLDESTWVVFITDHGLAFPRAKSTLYREGTGVACIVRPPRRRALAGRVYPDMFSGVDLTPTLLELLGVEIPDSIEGVSHADAFLAGRPAPGRSRSHPVVRDEVFTEKTYHDNFDPIRAVRTRNYAYIENYSQRPALSLPLDIRDSPSALALDGSQDLPRPAKEFYDLRVDPYERVNLIADPQYADEIADLAGRLTGWRESTGDRLPDERTGNAIAREFMARYQRQLASDYAAEPERQLPSRRPRGSERELRENGRGERA